MRGLKFVLSICMGSSFGKVAKSWVGITSEKFFCVVDVGSWHFSCQCLKSFLSHWTTCAMAWLNVERFGKVNNKSFTSLHNPNWNSFMNAASPHEILQANFLNFDAYTIIECDIWQNDCISMLNVRSLSKFPKVALNFSRNASKSLSKGD
jgi:hypothetical protein